MIQNYIVKYPNCLETLNVTESQLGNNVGCPQCDTDFTVPDPNNPSHPAPARKAKKIKAAKNTAGGIIVFLIGVGLTFWAFPSGIIFGLILIPLSVAMSRVWVCGDCGNAIEKTSSLCPTCKAHLVKRLPKK